MPNRITNLIITSFAILIHLIVQSLLFINLLLLSHYNRNGQDRGLGKSKKTFFKCVEIIYKGKVTLNILKILTSYSRPVAIGPK